MTEQCNWPESACACWMDEQSKPDPIGRVWMHSEEGLNWSKASMWRLLHYCHTHHVEIGDIYPFNANFPRSRVFASVRLRPEQFEEFEAQTKGKLRKPPKISLN